MAQVVAAAASPVGIYLCFHFFNSNSEYNSNSRSSRIVNLLSFESLPWRNFIDAFSCLCNFGEQYGQGSSIQMQSIHGCSCVLWQILDTTHVVPLSACVCLGQVLGVSARQSDAERRRVVFLGYITQNYGGSFIIC